MRILGKLNQDLWDGGVAPPTHRMDQELFRWSRPGIGLFVD